MTNLATAQKLAPSNLQLPVSAYFDADLYQREIELLFKQGPGYVGHELMVPEIGSYETLRAENEGRILFRNELGVELLSNVCRHRPYMANHHAPMNKHEYIQSLLRLDLMHQNHLRWIDCQVDQLHKPTMGVYACRHPVLHNASPHVNDGG